MLIASRDSRPQLHPSTPAPAILVRMLLDSVLAIAVLYGACRFFGVPFQGPYLILAILVFSLTFPGDAPRGTSAGALVRQVLGNWILVVGLLLLLGWATRTLGSVDERVIAAWVAFTPVSIFAGHMLLPIVLPKVLAAEGLQ